MPRPDRLERVTDLLLVLLDAPRPLSLRQIGDRVPGYPDGHGARRQAFERDKRLLRDEGVPVEVVPIGGEDQLGYRIDPDLYYLPDLGLEPGEQTALNLAVAGVHLAEPSGRAALAKLGAGGELERRDATVPLVDLRGGEGLESLSGLFEASRLRAAVSFGYRGRQRTVDVAGLRFRQGHWYLVAYERDRRKGRTFRVDRIDGPLEVGGAGSAELPSDFDVDEWFTRDPWRFGEGDATDVDVRIDAVEAARVVGELGPSAVVERAEDGSVVVRLPVTDMHALVLWVLDLLDHAEVLGPATARTAVVERLSGLLGSGGGRR